MTSEEKKEYQRAWHSAHPGYYAQRYRANPERGRNAQRKRRMNPAVRERERIAAQEYRERNPEKVREYQLSDRGKTLAAARMRKWCENHREESRARSWSGLGSFQKDSLLARKRERRANSNGRYLATDHAYRARNRERLRLWYKKRHSKARAGWLSASDWMILLDRYGHRCLCCGIQEKEAERGLVADHIIPVCMDGPNTIENAQPLCFNCNRRKNRRAIDYRPMFRAAQGGL